MIKRGRSSNLDHTSSERKPKIMKLPLEEILEDIISRTTEIAISRNPGKLYLKVRWIGSELTISQSLNIL